MSTPIICNITRERIINKSPTIADVNCSRAPFIASGLPCEDSILYPEIIINSKAIPPEILSIILKTLFIKPVASVSINIPRPVGTFKQFPLIKAPLAHGGSGAGGVSHPKMQLILPPPPVVMGEGVGLLIVQAVSPVGQLIRAEEIALFKFMLFVSGMFVVTSLHPEFPVSRLAFSHTVTLTPFICIELMVSFGKPNESPLI